MRGRVSRVKSVLAVMLSAAMVFGNFGTVGAAELDAAQTEAAAAAAVSEASAEETETATGSETVSEGQEETVSEENAEVSYDDAEAVAGDDNIVSGNCGKNGGSNLTYTFNKTTGMLKISGNGEMGDYSGNSPWRNYTVSGLELGNGITSIGRTAFLNCSALSGNLVIPETVVSIDAYAFEGCSALSGALIIPSRVTEIGVDAFEGAKSFTSLSLNEGLASIGDYAFKGCAGLSGNLIIPGSVKGIAVGAFYDCHGLSGNLKINYGVGNIGASAFYNCIGLSGDLIIPDSVTQIGNRAFLQCNGFGGNLILSKNITAIEEYTFHNDKFSGKLIIPDKVSTIGIYAFFGCDKLSSLELGKSVKIISSSAFMRLDSMSGDIAIPDSVSEIGGSAFAYDKCEPYIYSRTVTISSDAFRKNFVSTIHGYNISTAKKYASDYGFKFVPFTVSVDSVSLDKTSMKLAKGTSWELKATVSPDYADDTNVSWNSSDTKVATVSNDGTVTAVSVGNADITVTTVSGGKTAVCKVTVTETLSINSITLNKDSISLNKGASEKLTAAIEPETAPHGAFSWSSSDTKVATVSNDGTVTAISAGSAVITVTTVDGTKKATCKVTVTETLSINSITLNKDSISLNKGASEKLTAAIEPETAPHGAFSWSSSDTKVAAVSNDGTVTAISAGSAVITVTVNGTKTATCKVTVIESKPEPEPKPAESTVKVAAYTVSNDVIALYDKANKLISDNKISKDDEYVLTDGRSDTLWYAVVNGYRTEVTTSADATGRIRLYLPEKGADTVFYAWTSSNSGALDSFTVSALTVPAVTYTGRRHVLNKGQKAGSSSADLELHLYTKDASGNKIWLSFGSDYKVRYKDNLNAGKGTIEVIGINAYKGLSIDVPFTIEKCDLGSCVITPKEYVKYNAKYGDEEKLKLINNAEVKNGTLKLKFGANRDYVLSYEDMSGNAVKKFDDGMKQVRVVAAAAPNSLNYKNSVSSTQIMTVMPSKTYRISISRYTRSVKCSDKQTVSGADFINGKTAVTGNVKSPVSLSVCDVTLTGANKQDIGNTASNAGTYYLKVAPKAGTAAAGVYESKYVKVRFSGEKLKKADFTVMPLSTAFTYLDKDVTISAKGALSLSDVSVKITEPDGQTIEWNNLSGNSVSKNIATDMAGRYTVNIYGKGRYTGSSLKYIYTVNKIKKSDIECTVAAVSADQYRFAAVNVVYTKEAKTLQPEYDYSCVRSIVKVRGVKKLKVVIKGTGRAFSGTITKTQDLK